MSISKERGKTLLRLFVLFVLCSAMITTGIRKVYANPATTLSVTPSSIIDPNKIPGTTFTVDIYVENVADLMGFEFKLDYIYPELLNHTNIEIGSFVPPGSFPVDKSKPGLIFYNVGWFSPVSGSGTLATITFQVLGSGDTNLDLHDTKLSNSSAYPIDHTAVDGYFRNVAPGCIPTASFTYSPSYPPPVANQTLMTFDASASSDLDGWVSNYKWDFGDGTTTPMLSSPIITHTYSASGAYTVTLKVFDNDGITGINATAKTTIYVVQLSIHTITYNGQTFRVGTISNSTVLDDLFNPFLLWPSEYKINFTLFGPAGTTGFCNVTIPRDMLWVNPGEVWMVLLNGVAISPPFTVGPGNSTYNAIWFTYTHSPHTIEIVGTHVVPEFPTGTAIAALMIITLLAVAVRKMAWTKKHRGPTIAQ